MIRRNNQCELINHHSERTNGSVTRPESHHTDLNVATENLRWDPACKTALHFDLDLWMTRAKNWNKRQQSHHRIFIRAQRKLAPMQITQLANGRMRMMSQIHHLLRKFKQHATSRCKRAVFRRTIEERLAQFRLQPPD